MVAFLLTALLMLFPRLVLGPITYYERPYANQSMPVEFRVSGGDLFVALPGSIRPPSSDEVLQSFTIAWDADGFRVPARTAEHYPIAAFGDSFTEGANVPAPWPDQLAARRGTPVQNFGYHAYGPREVARAAEEFAGRSPREWIIYAYFSGNDLGDAMRGPKVDVSTPWGVWSALAARWQPVPTPAARDHYDFPMPVIIGGSYYEMALLSYYLWWQLAPPEGFENSENFRVLSDALDTITTTAAQSCYALVFIPTKEQLYYRYVYETERQWLRGIGHRLVMANDGRLVMVSAPIAAEDEAAFYQNLYGQRDAVRALVETKPGWIFIDLLPAFEQHVASGELLYYPYDSHWNQDGHTLAAQTIADALPAACAP